jgi:hypothetical protein
MNLSDQLLPSVQEPTERNDPNIHIIFGFFQRNGSVRGIGTMMVTRH